MDETTISKLAELLYRNWNHSTSKIDIKKSINQLFHRKKTSNVINEYKEYLETIPNGKKRLIPIMTVILVLALCRRNLDEEKVIYKSLKEHNLINPLYGGICTLLGGKSSMISIKISWNDNLFENKYEFINRFKGEFYYWNYIEIFVAVKIIYLEDPKLFEEIIKKDNTRLLSLNLPFSFLGVEVSDSFVLSMINDSDELYKSIGFYILTNNLNRYIRELEQNQRAKELGIEDLTVKSKTLEEKLSLEVNRVVNNLMYCNDATKVSLMINYLISEAPVIVTRFAELLLDTNLEQEFINELKGSNKIKTLDNIYHLLRVVSNTKRKKTKGHSKIKIYNVFVDLIILFVKERKGIYQWSEKEEFLMIEICKSLPKKSKDKLLRNLINESKEIMDRKLDELVRFDIYLKEKNRSHIINGMIELIQRDLYQR